MTFDITDVPCFGHFLINMILFTCLDVEKRIFTYGMKLTDANGGIRG